MKNPKIIITTALATLVILAACTNTYENLPENNKPKQEDSQNRLKIGGEWQWLYSSGGFAGETITPESKGISIKMKFNDSNKKYEVWKNNNKISWGSFNLSWEKSVFFQDSCWIMTMSPYPQDIYYDIVNEKQKIVMQNDTLALIPIGADMYNSVFKKK